MSITPVQQIVAEWRKKVGNGSGPLPYREFATRLNNDLEGVNISYQAIANWEAGINEPDIIKLLAMRAKTSANKSDWRYQFSGDLLAARMPDVYQPGSPIGQAALAHDKE